MRSDREEIPEPFTKADADKAETMEARISTARLTAGCQVYWPSPYEVCGAIKDKYNSLGGPSSFLLWPTSAELTNPNNSGKRTQFLNGPIYWSAAGGAHPVVNSILNRWGVHQYEAGWLGYPTTDEIVHADGIGRRQEFQNGAIYVAFTNAISSAIKNGPIRDKWNTVGAETPGSLLGYPIGDEIALPGGQGRMVRYERGVIYWHPNTGAYPVTGAILTQWGQAGYEQSSFGYPTADQTTTPGSIAEQQFQNGRLYTPGLGLQVGTGAQALTFGFPSSVQLTPALIPRGVVFHGNGYDLTFEVVTGKAIKVGIDLLAAQAPTSFSMMLGLPPGITIQQQNGRAKIMSGGAIIAAVGVPLAFNANGQHVPVQSTISGNTMTYQFSPNQFYPVKSYTDSISEGAEEFWDLGVNERNTCEINPIDCWRASDDRAKAYEVAGAAFSAANGTEDNRLDATRHCVWQGRTTESANDGFAEDIGLAHEQDWPSATVPAGQMDLYNNKTGRAVGIRNEDNADDIDSTCIQYAHDAAIVPNPNPMNNVDKDDLVILHE